MPEQRSNTRVMQFCGVANDIEMHPQQDTRLVQPGGEPMREEDNQSAAPSAQVPAVGGSLSTVPEGSDEEEDPTEALFSHEDPDMANAVQEACKACLLESDWALRGTKQHTRGSI